ncbi:uncharacterized protein LOC107013419 [Solanum pennellii]|uniref:Uncharacterized protein LOC107013419 n=1 Tax=Solanum pennellii TaxID=28526 RepID=A0ABM1GBS0_SOLPN|nr:uncharacterized protein LOC107013419 [Solanum pennellii]
MAPYEALMGEQADLLLGSLKWVNKVNRTRTSSSIHGEGEDVRRSSLEFEVDVWVYLKVLMKGVMKFGKKGKLIPWNIVPYRISKGIGTVAFELDLQQELVAIHPMFHISKLNKCVGDPSFLVQTDNVGIKDRLSYEEVRLGFLYHQALKLRTKEVASVKFLLRNQFVDEAT